MLFVRKRGMIGRRRNERNHHRIVMCRVKIRDGHFVWIMTHYLRVDERNVLRSKKRFMLRV